MRKLWLTVWAAVFSFISTESQALFTVDCDTEEWRYTLDVHIGQVEANAFETWAVLVTLYNEFGSIYNWTDGGVVPDIAVSYEWIWNTSNTWQVVYPSATRDMDVFASLFAGPGNPNPDQNRTCDDPWAGGIGWWLNYCEGDPEHEQCEGRSPILLDLDRDNFHFSAGPVAFDIDADGQKENLTWVSGGRLDAFLTLDRDGNGVIDNGSELFGTSTMLHSGARAKNGYEALAEFDLFENGGVENGQIDAADAIFSELQVWIEDNSDGVSQSYEMFNLDEVGVVAIGLSYYESHRIDQFGNELKYLGRAWMDSGKDLKTIKTTDVFFRDVSQ